MNLFLIKFRDEMKSLGIEARLEWDGEYVLFLNNQYFARYSSPKEFFDSLQTIYLFVKFQEKKDAS